MICCGSGGPELRVAFLGSSKHIGRLWEDPSFIYRAGNLGQALREAGHDVWLGHMRRFNPLQAWDVVVLHRPLDSVYSRVLCTWLRRSGVLVLADVDDLVFDERHAQHSPALVNGLQPQQAVRQRVRSHARALAGVDGITVSTQRLKTLVSELYPAQQVLWAPNAVHHSWLQMPLRGRSAAPVLTYNPGTRSHDRDFALVLPALAAVMAKRVDVQLRITGPLVFDASVLPASRVLHLPKVPFESFHECHAGAWLNLAPLQASPFNDCKSALKVLEAGWWGVPTVALNLPDAERFEGAASWLPKTPASFGDVVLDALSAVERGGVNCREMRESVFKQANVHEVASRWLQWVVGLRA